jgi:hypothetical protein
MMQQRIRTAANGPASLVRDVLASPARPLDAPTRAFFEPRFGHDFSRVRVHSDARAAESAAAIKAGAWTVGNDIAFGHGMYAPRTSHGRAVLAHELSHVVQQQGVARAAPMESGQAGDAYERDADAATNAIAADHHAQPRMRASAPRLQGFWGAVAAIAGGVVALAYGLYRLISDSFSRTELQGYLKWIRATKRIQDDWDSDNKARACVKREKELGPYSMEDRVLLINEMLTGFTLGGDEEGILAALRAAKPGEPAQIVARIGRGRLWSKFSGRNRRILEAVTLTAAEAGDALVTRLRDLDPGAIQDYVMNATDDAVRAAASRAASLRNITAPIPVNAAIDAAGAATFQINGIEVFAQPDEQSNEERLRGDAETVMWLALPDGIPVPTGDAQGLVAAFVPPRIQARVRTRYGPGTDPRKKAIYGRGTTDPDKFAARTSMRFHESRHGQDWFDFLADRKNAPPQFQGRVGMTPKQYGEALQTFGDELNAYNCRALEHSIVRSDCVGKHADERVVRRARGKCPIEVTICRQQGGIE